LEEKEKMVAKTKYVGVSAAAAGALVAVGLLTLMMVAVEVRPAEAAFPGQNGKIAYTHWGGYDYEIYTISASGGTPFNVTNNTTDDYTPSYSPDGTKIAYQAYDGHDDEIYTINATGGTPFQVTNNTGLDSDPSWGTTPPPDTQAPRVKSTSPKHTAIGVAPSANLTATFSETMRASTINATTFKLYKVNSDGTQTQITDVVVSLSSERLQAKLDPFGSSITLLSTGTKYKAVVTTEAKDVAGNRLDQNSTTDGLQQKTWSFTVSN